MKILINNLNSYPELFNEYENIFDKYNVRKIKITEEKLVKFYSKDILKIGKELILFYIEVESLDFLLQLEKDLKKECGGSNALIFRTLENGEYCETIDDRYIDN